MRDNQERVRPRNLLNSWKEIAAFVDRGVRTVQRWEREHQLPVHRIGNSPRAPVFALQEEILLWLRREQKITSATSDMEADQLIAQAQPLEERAKELRQQAAELALRKIRLPLSARNRGKPAQAFVDACGHVERSASIE